MRRDLLGRRSGRRHGRGGLSATGGKTAGGSNDRRRGPGAHMTSLRASRRVIAGAFQPFDKAEGAFSR
jgi:hypothetical protein